MKIYFNGNINLKVKFLVFITLIYNYYHLQKEQKKEYKNESLDKDLNLQLYLLNI